jgi:hypothetical protein
LNKEVTVRFGKMKMQLWDSMCRPHVNPVSSGAVGKDCQRRLLSRPRFVRAVAPRIIIIIIIIRQGWAAARGNAGKLRETRLGRCAMQCKADARDMAEQTRGKSRQMRNASKGDPRCKAIQVRDARQSKCARQDRVAAPGKAGQLRKARQGRATARVKP